MDDVIAALGCLWVIIVMAFWLVIGVLLVWGLYEAIMWIGRN